MARRTGSQLALFSLIAAAAVLVSPAAAGANCVTQPSAQFHITVQPQSQTVSPGATATLTVVVWTNPPDVCMEYEWFKRTSGNTYVSVFYGLDHYTTPPLTTTEQYKVVVNPFPFQLGNVEVSFVATITVLAPAHIYTQPQSQTIQSGTTATLSVNAVGPTPQSYQWYVGTSGNTSSPIGGATASSYTTPAQSNTTNYWVRVSNPYGPADSATATIDIGESPAITTQPQSQIIPSGSTATLNVAAAGTGPFTYQWYRGTSGDTSNPVGGGSSYTTPPLTTATNYWVRALNDYGTADSNTATITIGVAPNITTQPSGQTMCPGGVGTIGVAVTGTVPFTYQWYRGTSGDTSNPVGGGNSYTTPPLTTTTSYWVRASNAYGTADSATATFSVYALVVTPARATFGRAGGSGHANVTIDAACSWNASTLATWISFGVNGGQGDGPVTFSAEPNTSGFSRSASIRIRSGTFPGADQTVLVSELLSSGDFDGDGKADVLLRNSANGQTIEWLMNGSTVDNSAFLPTIADTNWEVQGVGDFDADGKADVIWRNKVSGQDIAWLMNGLTVINSAFLPTIADTNWEIVGVGVLDGDGKADVIWRNKVSGQDIAWLMNGLTVINSAFLPTIADTNWKIVGVGDVDGDGKADVLWRNSASGQDIAWLMDGLTVVNSAFLPTIADTNWKIVGVGDIDGDGKADVILRNNATGQNIGWLMDGLTVTNSAFLPTIADTNWEIKAIGDANGDGKADVILRNNVSGQNIVWLMDGLTVANSSFLPTIADLNWTIVGPR